MKKYESLFILDVRKVEDEGNALSKEFCSLVESWGGKITSADAMGRLQFSYESKSARPVSTGISTLSFLKTKST